MNKRQTLLLLWLCAFLLLCGCRMAAQQPVRVNATHVILLSGCDDRVTFGKSSKAIRDLFSEECPALKTHTLNFHGGSGDDCFQEPGHVSVPCSGGTWKHPLPEDMITPSESDLMKHCHVERYEEHAEFVMPGQPLPIPALDFGGSSKAAGWCKAKNLRIVWGK